MTDNLLKTALREAASREFAGMPQSDGDITYTFLASLYPQDESAYQG